MNIAISANQSQRVVYRKVGENATFECTRMCEVRNLDDYLRNQWKIITKSENYTCPSGFALCPPTIFSYLESECVNNSMKLLLKISNITNFDGASVYCEVDGLHKLFNQSWYTASLPYRIVVQSEGETVCTVFMNK